MKVRLLGGWGYFNLGDEALLAGYLETLSSHVELDVLSVDPARSSAAQSSRVRIGREGRASGPSDLALLGGGGYLNASWIPEIGRKLRRISRDSKGVSLATHAVEVRGFSESPLSADFVKLFGQANMTVRDRESALEAAKVVGDVSARVVVDSISLLYPHLDKYRRSIPELRGKVLFNLLDIARRPDSVECELDPIQTARFGAELVRSFGDRAVGLVVGEGDTEFMRGIEGLPLLIPRTVAGLVSALGSADAVYSVRMHPGLIASALGTPTLAVPYCGKVRPTLEHIGTSATILRSLDIDSAHQELGTPTDHSKAWSVASAEANETVMGLIETAVS